MGGEEDAVEWGKSKPFLLLPNSVLPVGVENGKKGLKG